MLAGVSRAALLSALAALLASSSARAEEPPAAGNFVVRETRPATRAAEEDSPRVRAQRFVSAVQIASGVARRPVREEHVADTRWGAPDRPRVLNLAAGSF